jgi:crotonobetainyl-CoA:carnitine CoA-transferase CaiB-like acyl-CoA transferase
MSKPFLAGVRVLDVTGALAGPYCTTILSDLGAEVIKVEPADGDSLRLRQIGEKMQPIPFDLIHRDKSSIAIDLKTPEGKEVLRRLARTADILVENFRTGAMAGLGLGYDDLKDECPDLVYCSISGFGQFGPMKDAKGIDLVAQAYGGLMSVTGHKDQIAKAGFPLSDLGTGMWAAVGVLAALMRARDGGGGAFIDVALADSIAAWTVWEVADFVASGEVPGPLGTAHRLVAPVQAFDCADAKTLVIGATDRSWSRLCVVLGLDEPADERFATEYLRFVNREALTEVLQQQFLQQPRDHWIHIMRDAGIPCGPVNTIDAVLADEQFAVRGMFLHDEVRHGSPIIVNTPIVSDGAPRARGRAPKVGEDTLRLLLDLGYTAEDIVSLSSAGVVSVNGEPAPSSQAPIVTRPKYSSRTPRHAIRPHQRCTRKQ